MGAELKLNLFIIVTVLLCSFLFVDAARGTASQSSSSSASSSSRNHHHHQKSSQTTLHRDKETEGEGDETIEDVDEDKIDNIVDDNDKNLVIVFCTIDFSVVNFCGDRLYSGSLRFRRQGYQMSTLQGSCKRIGRDRRRFGIRRIHRSCENWRQESGQRIGCAHVSGVNLLPKEKSHLIRWYWVLLFGENHSEYRAFLLSGEFDDSEIILRWIRAHDDVATVELEDSNFEEKTDSYSPSEGALDWFVML